jgi:hypothetical protein
MNRRIRRRHLIEQSVATAVVAAIAVAYAIHLVRKPLQPADLEIAAQSLHSYAAEAVMLAEQSLAGNVYRGYVQNEAQFLSGKAHEVASGLTGGSLVGALADLARQEVTAAQDLRTQLHVLRTEPEDTLRLVSTAQRLRRLSADMGKLEQQLR